eukprot:m.280650 g.280650  ORF g.280650 m.280650 type:complete len:72 (+) comp15750_c0_seq15:589-804(+)
MMLFHVPDFVSVCTVDCFVTLLETLRVHPKTKLVYASSSSVYGKGASVPFTEDECSDQPTNVYAQLVFVLD